MSHDDINSRPDILIFSTESAVSVCLDEFYSPKSLFIM